MRASIVLNNPVTWQYLENPELKLRKIQQRNGGIMMWPYAVHDQILAEFAYSKRLEMALGAMAFDPEDYSRPLLTEVSHIGKTYHVSIRKVGQVADRLQVLFDVMNTPE